MALSASILQSERGGFPVIPAAMGIPAMGGGSRRSPPLTPLLRGERSPYSPSPGNGGSLQQEGRTPPIRSFSLPSPLPQTRVPIAPQCSGGALRDHSPALRRRKRRRRRRKEAALHGAPQRTQPHRRAGKGGGGGQGRGTTALLPHPGIWGCEGGGLREGGKERGRRHSRVRCSAPRSGGGAQSPPGLRGEGRGQMERGSAVWGWGWGGAGGRGKVSPRLCRNAAQPRERLPVGMGLGEPLRLDPTAPRGVTGTERGRTVAEPGPVGRWEEPLSPRPAAAAPQRPAVLFPPLPSTDGGPEGGSIPPPPPQPRERSRSQPAPSPPPRALPQTNRSLDFLLFNWIQTQQTSHRRWWGGWGWGAPPAQ